ncbi:hypothetical protein Ciccas_001508 [Cichlidogyrus casuarinus]|uniref:Uncharacterized protein n=1 Tax=Cichlidogyrus casuarinus TaxID=1844966 RepID=A0ABD2QJS5_9PLAT
MERGGLDQYFNPEIFSSNDPTYVCLYFSPISHKKIDHLFKKSILKNTYIMEQHIKAYEYNGMIGNIDSEMTQAQFESKWSQVIKRFGKAGSYTLDKILQVSTLDADESDTESNTLSDTLKKMPLRHGKMFKNSLENYTRVRDYIDICDVNLLLDFARSVENSAIITSPQVKNDEFKLAVNCQVSEGQ